MQNFTAEPIKMPFAGISHASPRIHEVDGAPNPPQKRALFTGNMCRPIVMHLYMSALHTVSLQP